MGLLPAPRSSDHSCAAATSTATTLPSGRMSMASEFWETLVWTSTCSHELHTEAGGAVHENALVLLGIGIDESTAFEIAGGVCGVQGRPRVAFYNSGAWTASAQARSRECSPWDEEPFLLCNSGEQFSLRSRRIITAGIGDIQPKSNL